MENRRSALEFNDEFNEAVHLLEKTNHNLFLTGKAGTGKSTLLDHFRNTTQKKIAVLAPTGVAAVNILGQTIHSFFRFSPGVSMGEIPKIVGQYPDKLLILKLDTLIIDEISMVRADLLDCVDLFLRTLTKKPFPFGGIQMAFIGDLYQLPPVVVGKEKEALAGRYNSPFFFDAEVMKELTSAKSTRPIHLIELEKIYRQQDDEFIHLLNSVRNNSITDEQLVSLNRRVVPVPEEAVDHFIYLTSTNQQAGEINRTNLERLPAPLQRFDGTIAGSFEEKSLPNEQELYLKRDARVMLLNNDSYGRWVNGTLGTIRKIKPEEISVTLDEGETVEVEPLTWKLFRMKYNEAALSIENEEIGSFTQFPLKLAWAITIHKSQGKTFDRVIVDIGRGTFAHGQMYVALSRCRSFEGMILKKPVEKRHLIMDRRVIRFLTQLQYKLSEKDVPLKEKMKQIHVAIEQKKKLKIVYLKGSDEKSRRTILPLSISEMEYLGYPFTGLQAHCFSRNAVRVFRMERILKIEEEA